VERSTRFDRASVVAAAAAHDLNDELTVILNSVSSSLATLDPAHPARPLLLELQSAAQRCVWKTSALLNFGLRRGVRPVATPLERLLEWDNRESCSS
jgi:hypothetical protein